MKPTVPARILVSSSTISLHTILNFYYLAVFRPFHYLVPCLIEVWFVLSRELIFAFIFKLKEGLKSFQLPNYLHRLYPLSFLILFLFGPRTWNFRDNQYCSKPKGPLFIFKIYFAPLIIPKIGFTCSMLPLLLCGCIRRIWCHWCTPAQLVIGNDNITSMQCQTIQTHDSELTAVLITDMSYDALHWQSCLGHD